MIKMSKIVAALCIAGMIAGVIGFGMKTYATQNRTAEPANEAAESATETPEDAEYEEYVELSHEMLCGGWSYSEDPAITESVKEVFDKATAELTGVDYEPVVYIGSQVVAGTNHCILCKAQVVVPGSTPFYTLMYIYEDLEGNATILDFADIELGVN